MYYRVILLVVLVLAYVGAAEADDDANFRLTILIEMDWSEGDMYRNYLGTADLYVSLSEIENDSNYEDYIISYQQEYPDEPVPEYLGSVEGSGELTVEGSGSSGNVEMTFTGTAHVLLGGSLVIHPDFGQVMEVTISGNTDEVWIVHTPDGDITMPQNAPITPVSLRFQYGNDEVSFSEPWDEGMTHQTYSLAIMYDPFTDPTYEGPLPGN